MPNETATVETLTAEVRVLMVGSRQITLSVARQLDEVAYWDITPFGRISLNIKPEWGEKERIDVIGRDGHGSLVRSSAIRFRYICDLYHTAGTRGMDGGQAVYRQCSLENVHRDHEWYGSDEEFQEWKNLPLIVLAGLR